MERAGAAPQSFRRMERVVQGFRGDPQKCDTQNGVCPFGCPPAQRVALRAFDELGFSSLVRHGLFRSSPSLCECNSQPFGH